MRRIYVYYIKSMFTEVCHCVVWDGYSACGCPSTRYLHGWYVHDQFFYSGPWSVQGKHYTSLPRPSAPPGIVSMPATVVLLSPSVFLPFSVFVLGSHFFHQILWTTWKAVISGEIMKLVSISVPAGQRWHLQKVEETSAAGCLEKAEQDEGNQPATVKPRDQWPAEP